MYLRHALSFLTKETFTGVSTSRSIHSTRISETDIQTGIDYGVYEKIGDALNVLPKHARRKRV